MVKQTITAFYDNREYANNAALMLSQAGVPTSDITISPETAGSGFASDTEPHAKGFWASLEELFGGTDDHATYTEGLRRGGIMLTAHVDGAKVDEAVEIVERHGSVDLDERETTWRGEGWTGASAITGGGIANEGAGPLRSLSPVVETETDVVTARTAVTPPSPVRTAPTVPVDIPVAPVGIATTAPVAGRDDVLQVAEETMNVGKRAVSRGKVRIHSYVVETPFVQNVSLRDETVTVDRRPMDRPLAAADLDVDAFKDRTLEMEEIDEEAFVVKNVRLVEEIGLRKDVTDRTQTINDSVRSTKVDIEDDRTVGRAATLFGDAVAVQRAKDMEVLGSDGQHVGVIDHVDGTTIKLKRIDPASAGSHHLIPTDWVQTIDKVVRLKVTASDAKSRWTAA